MRFKLFSPCFAAASAALLLSLGLFAAEGLEVTVCSDGVRQRRDLAWPTSSPVYDSAKNEIHIQGARNEAVGFQIFLRANAAKIEQVNISADDLSGEGGVLEAKNIEFLRAWFVQTDAPSCTGQVAGLPPGEYPDPLVPLNAPRFGAPFDLAGKTEILFADLTIPPQQSRGTYQGVVHLTAGGKPLRDLTLKVTVWGFTLPDETHFKTAFAYSPEFLCWGFRTTEVKAVQRLEALLHRVAHRHRMNLAVEFPLPVIARGWNIWAWPYREYLDGKLFTDGPGKGVPEYGFSIRFKPTQVKTTQSDEDISKLQKRLVAEDPTLTADQMFRLNLKLAADYIKFRHWAPEQFQFVCFDHPTADQYPLVQCAGKQVREATGGRLKLFLPDCAPQAEFQDFVDIWEWKPVQEDLPLIEERRKAGQHVWFSGGLGAVANPCVDGYGYGARSWAWVAWKYGFEGFRMWQAAYWVDKLNLPESELANVDKNPEAFLNIWKNPAPPTFDEARKRGGKREAGDTLQNGGGVFLYPGVEVGLPQAVIVSQRAKEFRRGAQDYEYLWLLKQAGEELLAQEALKRIYLPEAATLKRGGSPSVKTGDLGVTMDDSVWEDVRRQMGERLDKTTQK